MAPLSDDAAATPPVKRGRGRPKGSKNYGGDPSAGVSPETGSKGARLAARARGRIGQGVAARAVSVRGSLSEAQRAFCLHVTNGVPHPQAAKLALTNEDGKVVDSDGSEIDAKALRRRAREWMREPLVVAYLEELEATPAVSARLMRATQVKTGDDAEAMRAAKEILLEEASSGHREAAEQWAEHLCAVGATVIVPFPAKTRGLTTCPCGCDHLFEVELPVRAEVPFGELFPHIAERVAAPGAEATA